MIGSRKFLSCHWTLLLLILTVPVPVPAAGPQSPSVSFAPATISVGGVSRGGHVLWFGHGLTYRSGVIHRQRFVHVARDEDGDGVVTYSVDVPKMSVWCVVDFESGEYTLAAPRTSRLREIVLPDLVWRGGTSHIDISRDELDILFVRPRVGAWTVTVRQGGSRDDDGVNDAILRAALRAMTPMIGTGSTPPTATPRDIIVIIDPRELDMFARRAE